VSPLSGLSTPLSGVTPPGLLVPPPSPAVFTGSEESVTPPGFEPGFLGYAKHGIAFAL